MTTFSCAMATGHESHLCIPDWRFTTLLARSPLYNFGFKVQVSGSSAAFFKKISKELIWSGSVCHF